MVVLVIVMFGVIVVLVYLYVFPKYKKPAYKVDMKIPKQYEDILNLPYVQKDVPVSYS